ncbi:hypothetical protein WA026_022880 [Henosepilachna vigintioctopunctata]|uniref:Uncharacterized protein n=1 Tax=Henosepilachna vigintioctopunctata TaxID=420089 RepID=A0AAW1UDC1_9CUCU
MERLQFKFQLLNGTDEKFNILCVTEVTTQDGHTHKIPDDYCNMKYHVELIKTATLTKVKKALEKRNQMRNVWVSLTEELKNIYYDDGNLQFDDEYLEEITHMKETEVNFKGYSKAKNIGRLANDFIIEKFDAGWKEWRETFCNTFASKGWSPIRYALALKYQTGSFLQFSIEKERLLSQVRKTIDNGTLIDLIASGLPNHIMDKYDRKKLTETEDLHKELGEFEHFTYEKNFELKNIKPNTREKIEKTPCKICKEENKGAHFHPLSECWFKDQGNKNERMKQVSNLALDVDLSNDDPKKLIVPPLIELKIKLNDILDVPAIYDPNIGSNVSLINSKLVHFKTKNNNIRKTNSRTINGVYKTDGLIKLKLKILNMEDYLNVFIINNENFKYNFLIGFTV